MTPPITAAIVDYGLGNLFSVQQACETVGMSASITTDKAAVLAADLVLLPGVGAYADAMAELRRLDLVQPLQDIAAANRPLVGICLGLQLMMTESYEFGVHPGLGIFDGIVTRFENPVDAIGGTQRVLKVPQVGWNRVRRASDTAWENTPLNQLTDGDFMYFVHSFYVKPTDPAVITACSTYGGIEFCSAARRGNIFACQFHPERSGPAGIEIYRQMAHIAETYRSATPA